MLVEEAVLIANEKQLESTLEPKTLSDKETRMANVRGEVEDEIGGIGISSGDAPDER